MVRFFSLQPKISLMQYYFSGFTYDSKQCKLWYRSSQIKITKRNSELLYYFLKNNQGMINKEELIDHVWNGRVVTGNTIDQNILKLKKLLINTKPGNYMESVYGLGVRFIPNVTTSSQASDISAKNNKVIAGVAMFFILVSIFWYVSLKPKNPDLSKLNLNISHNKISNKHEFNNWLIYAGGRYLTDLLDHYKGFEGVYYSQENLLNTGNNVLSLQFSDSQMQSYTIYVDFNNSSQDLYIAKITEYNQINVSNVHTIETTKIHILFTKISQWVVNKYTKSSQLKDNIESVFTQDEYALESYFRGIKAQQTGNVNLAITFLKTATQQDSDFKYAWYELAVAYRKQGDTRKALSILSAIKTEHSLLNYHITLVSAQCLDILQEYNKAEKKYQNAYQLAVDIQFPEKQAAVLISQAIMFRKLEKYQQAEALLEKALKIINIETNPALYGSLSNSYAKLEREQRHYESAIEKSITAIEAFNKAGNMRRESSAKTTLSSILLIRNDFREAKKWISESLFYAQEAGSNRGISDSKTKLAMIYQKTGKFDLAIKNWNEVIDLTELLTLPDNQAQANLWLVKLHLHKDNITNALINIKKIEHIYQEEPKSSIKNLLHIAQLFLALKKGEFEKAKTTLALIEENDYWQSVLFRGDLAFLQKEYEAAESYYLDYFNRYRTSGKFDTIVEVLNRLSQLYIATNSNKLIENVHKTASYNPPIYPYNVIKAQLAYMQNKEIEAKSLITEAKIKSKDLWQQVDEFIYQQIINQTKGTKL